MYFLLALGLQVISTKAGTKFPGRRESILGKTYFNSEQLLNTENDDVKPFIAEFTLPETGLEVSGSAQEIHEQFEHHNKENVTYNELVINLKFKWNDRYSLLDLNLLHSIHKIKELWIFTHNVRGRRIFTMLVNITEKTLESLTQLHILSLNSRVIRMLYVSSNILNIVHHQLETFHWRGVDLRTTQLDPSHTLACITAVISSENYNTTDEYACAKKWYRGLTRNNSLRVLASQYKEQVLFVDIFKFVSNLLFLQVTQTTMTYFPADIHMLLPHLKVLDVSHNMENVVCTYTNMATNFDVFLTEVLLFHPSLELLISVNNNGELISSKKRQLAEDASAHDVKYELGDIEDVWTSFFASYTLVNDTQAVWKKTEHYSVTSSSAISD